MESQTNEENESNDNTIKTTISCPYSICDENGQVLPNGNYYFTIIECNDTHCKGSLTAKGKYGEFIFKMHDVIKMMSIAQSRLARRCNLAEDGMPDYLSPPVSPENSSLTKQLNQEDVIQNYFYTPDQCSICLSMISEGRKRLKCKHSFHKSCINKWLGRDVRCPICRQIHTEPVKRRAQSVPDAYLHKENTDRSSFRRRRNRTSLPRMNLRQRYNNYVVPQNNYVDPEAYGKK